MREIWRKKACVGLLNSLSRVQGPNLVSGFIFCRRQFDEMFCDCSRRGGQRRCLTSAALAIVFTGELGWGRFKKKPR
jgi:hypothetical protein